ncbi:Chaperone DnaK [Entamoeba marina]
MARQQQLTGTGQDQHIGIDLGTTYCSSAYLDLATVEPGAAIYARNLSRDGGMNATKIINHVPHSIGVEIAQGSFLKIIDKNSIVPAEGYQDLTLEPGVKQSTIRIYQGESKYADAPGMKFVKSFILKNNSQSTTSKPVQIHFKFNLNGIIEATAKALNDENNEASVSVEMVDSLTDEVVEKCLKEIYDLMPSDF